MANYPNAYIRKIKLIKIVEMLRQDSDEHHPLTTSVLIKRLAELNIPCNSEVLHRDMNALNDCGFEVLHVYVGHEKGFYMAERTFSVPELKIMIDAIQAASFITEKKTKELTKKIAALGGSFRAEILKKNIVCFNTRKHSNETIYYTVEALETALLNKNKVGFHYFDLNEKGKRVYRKDKKQYIVEPMALVYHEDNYYLMCYSIKYNGVTNYRVDRMTEVEILDETISDITKEEIAKTNVGKYTEQVFKMYGGEHQEVTIQFNDRLIGAVYDKFGEKTKMVRISEDSLVASVEVQVSPTFFGWVFQFGDRMKILSPENVAEQFESMK